MTRRLLWDLYSCAGGAGVGYHRAGFEVVGFDINPQPRYPFEFHQADALDVLAELVDVLRGDAVSPYRLPVAIHASPPCQKFSAMSQCRPGLADDYPDLVGQTRELLEATGLPYVIENVPGAPVRADVTLCGRMFGRQLYRHRLFESNVALTQPDHPAHTVPASRAGHWVPGTVMSIAGNVGNVALARELMDMDWTNRRELGEAIPPYYTEHIGQDLLAAITEEAAA